MVYFVITKLKHKRMNYGITGYNKPGFQVLEVQKFHAQVAWVVEIVQVARVARVAIVHESTVITNIAVVHAQYYARQTRDSSVEGVPKERCEIQETQAK